MPRKFGKNERRAYAIAMARNRRVVRSQGRYVRGSGDYQVVVPAKGRKGGFNAVKTGRNAGSAAGSYLGTLAAEAGNLVAPGVGFLAPVASRLGSMAGGALGAAGGKLFRSITGYGDYTIRSNSLMNTGPALFGDTSIRVRNREFVTFINGSSSFFVDPFNVNPGLKTTFPWLSSISNCYQQWRPHGIIFEYIPLAYNAVASTNPTSGSVTIASNYVSDEDNFGSVQEAMTNIFSNSCKPSDKMVHAIECDMSETPQKWFYVRAGDPPPNADVKLYDLCKTQVVTQGQDPSTTQIGMLWVSYDISLQKQTATSLTGKDLWSSHWAGTGQTEATSKYFPNAVQQQGSNLPCIIDDDSIQFPANLGSGRFLWIYGCLSTATAVAVATPTITYAGCSSISNIFFGDSTSHMTNNGDTSKVFLDIRFVQVTAEDASMTLSGGTLPKAATATWDLIICQIPEDLLLSKALKKIVKKIPRSKQLLIEQQRIDKQLNNPDDYDYDRDQYEAGTVTVVPYRGERQSNSGLSRRM